MRRDPHHPLPGGDQRLLQAPGDLPAIPILVGLGFDELSMTPGRIPAAKARIRSLDATVCRELAARSLLCESADDVERLVRESLPG